MASTSRSSFTSKRVKSLFTCPGCKCPFFMLWSHFFCENICGYTAQSLWMNQEINGKHSAGTPGTVQKIGYPEIGAVLERQVKENSMQTELQKRVYRIKATALMRAREHMSSVELVHWWEKFLQKTQKAKRFEELDEEMQAQIFKWESSPYKVIGS